jgi:hypothetical protein
MTFRLKIGDEIREYSTLKGNNETAGEGGFKGPLPLYWETSCGHWDYEDGNKYEYGCEHIECAMQSLRYGVVPYNRDSFLGLIPVLKPLVFIVLLFVQPVLPFLLLISDFIALNLTQRPVEKQIKAELEEFRKKHTVGDVKAEQIKHHTGSQSDHIIPKYALWVRLLPEMTRTADMLFVFFILFTAICLADAQINQYSIDLAKGIEKLIMPLVFSAAAALAFRQGIPFKWFFNPMAQPDSALVAVKPEIKEKPENTGIRKKNYGDEYFILHGYSPESAEKPVEHKPKRPVRKKKQPSRDS